MKELTSSRTSALLSLLLLAPVPSLAVLMAMVLFPGPLGQAAFFIGALWFTLLPAVWYRFVDHQRWSLSPARKGGFVVTGYWLWGASLIDPAIIRQAAQKNGLSSPVIYGLGCLYWVTLNSLKEEYAFRWFMVMQLRKLTGVRTAIVLAGVFFTIHHVIAMAVQGFALPVVVLAGVGVFIGGVYWAWMYVRYESVWPGYVSHAIVDVAVFGVGWLIIMG
jgi:membrane protease YdiL (CAAX protease family)